MLGAIIGDIVGSRFEYQNCRSKNFNLFDRRCFFTDDTVMTCAVAKALLTDADVAQTLKQVGRNYPYCGYGSAFGSWIFSYTKEPYYSFGNGAAMRVSPVGFIANSEEEVKKLAYKVTSVTHDHPEGLKGAEVTAMCVYYAYHGYNKDFIRAYAVSKYPEIASFDYENLKKNYFFNETCQNTVPQAIYCFLISDSFEDCIRTGISIGGDSDTLCAICGGIAEAFYGIPENIKREALRYFNIQDKRILLKPLYTFANKCGLFYN